MRELEDPAQRDRNKITASRCAVTNCTEKVPPSEFIRTQDYGPYPQIQYEFESLQVTNHALAETSLSGVRLQVALKRYRLLHPLGHRTTVLSRKFDGFAKN